MDDIVKQAMAKWPNVPHCYGWLALDARGGWRMRDEHAQAANLPGDKIFNAALLGFINRNYTHDDQGRWYFQNGPQRVYVNLEATPYIARTDPEHGFMLHTGQPMTTIEGAWMTEAGQLILKGGDRIAVVDDRDMAQCIGQFRIADAPLGDDELLNWLSRDGSEKRNNASLTLRQQGKQIPVQRIQQNVIADYFGFVKAPQADTGHKV